VNAADDMDRIMRSLMALMGNDKDAAALWMGSHNKHLDGSPAALCLSEEGRLRVMGYLAMVRREGEV
jgi:hypothetical protein